MEQTEIPEVTVVEKNANPFLEPIKTIAKVFGKYLTSLLTLLSEIAVVAVLGSMVGSYLTAKTAITDCQHVNLAKLGDVYVKCSLVEQVKDAVTAPPR